MAIGRDLRRLNPLMVALLLLAVLYWLMVCSLQLENEATGEEVGYTYIWGHIRTLREHEIQNRRRHRR